MYTNAEWKEIIEIGQKELQKRQATVKMFEKGVAVCQKIYDCCPEDSPEKKKFANDLKEIQDYLRKFQESERTFSELLEQYETQKIAG